MTKALFTGPAKMMGRTKPVNMRQALAWDLVETFSKCRNTMERCASSVPWASNLGLVGRRE